MVTRFRRRGEPLPRLRARVQGRHPEQSSDALGAAASLGDPVPKGVGGVAALSPGSPTRYGPERLRLHRKASLSWEDDGV